MSEKKFPKAKADVTHNWYIFYILVLLEANHSVQMLILDTKLY